MLFPECCQIQLGKDIVADTTAETTSTVEDMAGYDEITWIVKLGDVDAAAVLTFAPKENTADSVSSPTPTAVTLTKSTIVSDGTAGTITTGAVVVTESSGNIDDKIFVITLQKSAMTKRYAFLSITATVESYEVDAIITIKSRPKSLPVAQPTDVFLWAYAAA